MDELDIEEEDGPDRWFWADWKKVAGHRRPPLGVAADLRGREDSLSGNAA